MQISAIGIGTRILANVKGLRMEGVKVMGTISKRKRLAWRNVVKLHARGDQPKFIADVM